MDPSFFSSISLLFGSGASGTAHPAPHPMSSPGFAWLFDVIAVVLLKQSASMK